MSKDDNQQPVLFTQRQYEYLNKMYPEKASPSLTNDELRFYLGQRSMVMFIGSKLQR